MDFELWTSDFGIRTLDFGLRTSGFGLQTLDFGLWTMDFRLWTGGMQSIVLGTPCFVVLIEYRSGYYSGSAPYDTTTIWSSVKRAFMGKARNRGLLLTISGQELPRWRCHQDKQTLEGSCFEIVYSRIG